MTLNLFDSRIRVESRQERLGPGAWVLCGFATPVEAALLAALQDVIAMVPFRHMVTPGGFRMSVAMTNCGSLGWITDRTGINNEWGLSHTRPYRDMRQQAGIGYNADSCIARWRATHE